MDLCSIILNTGVQTADSIELSAEEFAALEELDSELSMQFTNDCPFFVKDYVVLQGRVSSSTGKKKNLSNSRSLSYLNNSMNFIMIIIIKLITTVKK